MLSFSWEHLPHKDSHRLMLHLNNKRWLLGTVDRAVGGSWLAGYINQIPGTFETREEAENHLEMEVVQTLLEEVPFDLEDTT